MFNKNNLLLLSAHWLNLPSRLALGGEALAVDLQIGNPSLAMYAAEPPRAPRTRSSWIREARAFMYLLTHIGISGIVRATMLKMRLQRIGRKNDPSYRVLVVDSRQGPKSGKYVDLLGSYNPKMDRVQVNGEKAKDWIAKGAQVSPTVHNILVGQNIIEGKKINVLPRKSPIVKEELEAKAEEKTEASEVDISPEATTQEPSDSDKSEAAESKEESTEKAKTDEVSSLDAETSKEEVAEDAAKETDQKNDAESKEEKVEVPAPEAEGEENKEKTPAA